MAVPECPEWAASGASMAMPLMTLMPSSTSLGSWTTGGEVSNVMINPNALFRPAGRAVTYSSRHGFPHAGAPKQ